MLAGVNVLADDIHILVARIPRGILTVPDPNQVVQPVDVRQAVVHEFVQLQVRIRAGCAPPEPAAACLVQRAPQHRHIRILQALELHGNRVDIVQQHLVAVRVSAVHRTGKVEFRLVGVERAPRIALALIIAGGRAPVPAQRDDTALAFVAVPILNCSFDDVGAVVAFRHARRRIGNQVHAKHRGIIAARTAPDRRVCQPERPVL